MIQLNPPSPVESITFQNQHFFLKRDDLIDPHFSGNKARKFYYYLIHGFPHVKKIISYGSPQSNAMYSLSVLAKMKGSIFEYYVDHIAEFLKENPHGNYKAALNNNMKIICHSGLNPESKKNEILNQVQDDKSCLFIEEGGRQKEAEYGIKLLAEEIIEWQKKQGIKKLNVFLPSGTGTTAIYLQKHCYLLTATCSLKTQVFTTPCVGESDYLKKQFSMLEADKSVHPVILEAEKKYHFGKLYKEHYEIWLKLRQQTGVTFDLLYDPIGWRVLMAHPEIYSSPTLYIHQGGILGNESMLPRYERKYKDVM